MTTSACDARRTREDQPLLAAHIKLLIRHRLRGSQSKHKNLLLEKACSVEISASPSRNKSQTRSLFLSVFETRTFSFSTGKRMNVDKLCLIHTLIMVSLVVDDPMKKEVVVFRFFHQCNPHSAGIVVQSRPSTDYEAG